MQYSVKSALVLSMRYLGVVVLSVVLAETQQVDKSLAFDTIVSESSCRTEGFARPLRQTIVILDEAAIDAFGSGPVSEANRRVNRTILSLAGVMEGQTATVSAPRERITLFFAREDGKDLIRAFTGCPPTYSQDEIARIDKAGSGIQGELMKFIGHDARAQIETQKLAFESSLLQTMTGLSKIRNPEVNGQDRGPEGIGFLQALSLSGSAIDLTEGIPRVVVISPMTLPILTALSDAKAARELGFGLASKLGVDFERAEVYLTGLSDHSSTYTRDFARALFLGMKGHLVAASGVALPAFAEAPQSVRIFGGFIDYVGVKVPMQVRLAVDQSGSLENSWVEVSVVRPVATPLTGKAICTKSDVECNVQGDGNEFSQSWVADVHPNPTFDQKLPFSGVRYFQLTTSASGQRGEF